MVQCYSCKKTSGSLKPLGNRRTKFVQQIYKNFTQNDKLCHACREKVHKAWDARMIKLDKKTSIAGSSMEIYSSQNPSSASSMLSQETSSTVSDEVDKLIYKTPNHPATRAIAESINRDPNIVGESGVKNYERRKRRKLTQSQKQSENVHSSELASSEAIELLPSSESLERESIVPIVPSTTTTPIVPTTRRAAALSTASPSKRTASKSPARGTPRRVTPIVTSPIRDPDDDDTPDIQSLAGPSDLVHVRPIIPRSRRPIVFSHQHMMDIYLAGTSGG